MRCTWGSAVWARDESAQRSRMALRTTHGRGARRCPLGPDRCTRQVYATGVRDGCARQVYATGGKQVYATGVNDRCTRQVASRCTRQVASRCTRQVASRCTLSIKRKGDESAHPIGLADEPAARAGREGEHVRWRVGRVDARNHAADLGSKGPEYEYLKVIYWWVGSRSP